MLSRGLKYVIGLSAMLVPIFAWAHGAEVDEHIEPVVKVSKTVAEQLQELSVDLIIYAAIFIAVLVIISLLIKQKSEILKKWLFGLMLVAIVVPTLLVTGSTVYLNIASVTKGPVHWHADFQIFNCGEHVHLKKPTGLSNRTGTEVFHEHGDDRIHVEGVVVELSDISLGSFFSTVGGHLIEGELELVTDGGLFTMTSGARCPENPRGHHHEGHDEAESGDFAGRRAWLQAFLYQTIGDEVVQTKLEDYANYIPAPESIVPPGDCVIFEFTPELKDRTDKICDFYQIEITKGKLRYVP